jgi:hypothetical protein
MGCQSASSVAIIPVRFMLTPPPLMVSEGCVFLFFGNLLTEEFNVSCFFLPYYILVLMLHNLLLSTTKQQNM